MAILKTNDRIFNTDTITHAVIGPENITVNPADYRPVVLAGEEKKHAIAVLREAGFVGDDTLVNPRRVSVVEFHSLTNTVRIYLEGADRLLYMPAGFQDQLFPAQETVEQTASKKAARKAPKASE